MPNNTNRRNQPPTGEGKRQSPHRGHPELNLGDADEERASREVDRPRRARPKAGR